MLIAIRSSSAYGRIAVALPSSVCNRQTNPGLRSASALIGSSCERNPSMIGSSMGARSRPMLTCARLNVTMSSNPDPQIQILTSPDPHIPRSSHPQILRSPDPQIPRSSNPQILKSSDPQILKSLSALLPVNAVPQRLPCCFCRDEQVVRHFRDVAQHVGINRVGLVQVETEPGKVLQPQVAVAIDRRVAQPR